MLNKSLEYHVLVVRAWKHNTADPEQNPWRFTLIGPGTQERRGFSESAALCDAIHVTLQELIEQGQEG